MGLGAESPPEVVLTMMGAAAARVNGGRGSCDIREQMRIGVDLGGTKIEVIVLADDGAELLRRRCATPASEGYEAIVQAIARLVEDAEAEVGGAGIRVGIGTPGAVAPGTGRMRNCNTTCLNGKPLPADLSTRLGRDIRMANDANCFALSEAVDGAGAGADVVFGVIVGTGTGGGLVVRGKVLTGPNAIAGEWGHNPLPSPNADELPGPSCYCGRRGCIETYLSGTGLARDHAEHHGSQLRAPQIAEAAERGDADAVVTLDRYVDRMARALASVINVVDPDVIVLGGGVSRIDRLYRDVPKRWGQYVFTDTDTDIATRLLPAMHGDSSGVRGAAWLWT